MHNVIILFILGAKHTKANASAFMYATMDVTMNATSTTICDVRQKLFSAFFASKIILEAGIGYALNQLIQSYDILDFAYFNGLASLSN